MAKKHPDISIPSTPPASNAIALATLQVTLRKIKAAVLRDLLLQPAGARLHGLMFATGCQAHTVRSALSGLRKAGVEIIRTTRDAGTVYTASAPADAPVTPAAGKTTPPRARGKNPADSCARTPLSVATADATKPEVPS